MRNSGRATRSLGGLFVALSLFAFAAPAHADDAATHLTQATSLYDDENYAGALVEFETAYQLTHDYNLLSNIGICQTMLKDFAGAELSFRRFLREGGAAIGAEERAQIEGRLATLGRSTAPVKITTNAPPGSQVTIDDQSIGDTPLPETVPVKFGHRVFAITSNGHTVTRTVDLVAGSSSTIALDFDASDTVALRDSDAAAVAGQSFHYIWWGITAGIGAAAIVTGSVAIAQRNDAARAQATFGVSKETLIHDRDNVRSLGIVTDSFLVLTVASAAIATYFTIDYFSKKKKQAIGLYVTPFGAGYARTF